MSERMIVFSPRKRRQDAVKSAQSKFSNTLSCSMKLSMEFVSFDVRFGSFLMSSGDVRDALVMYSWSSLIDNISSSSSSTTTNSVNPFWAVR